MSTRILVVDDEPSVRDLLAYNLRKARYDVLLAADGRTALRLAHDEKPDLILLDLMLPQVDGLDVCRELRRAGSIPVIMLTALGEETDRVVGLEVGADDYVTKPFSMRELMARVKAVLRRTRSEVGRPGAAVILHGPGDLTLDAERREATIAGRRVELTRLEFDLLHSLLAGAGRVLSREVLLEQAWGYDFAGDTRAVDSAIKRLRAALRRASPEADAVESVRGVGYRIRG